MRPTIICHMASSLDGRIEGISMKGLLGKGEYEKTGASLKGDAWICGRTTMQMHFAAKRPFVSHTKKLAGRREVHVARRASSYAVSVDTLGKLQWSSDDVYGDHLICVVSEKAAAEYLGLLKSKGISYIVTGKNAVDLPQAAELLRTHFGIRRLLLEGGGNINGAFLEAGLIDEVSLLVTAGIDGRKGVPTVFDGIGPHKTTPAILKLKSVARLSKGSLWLRYKVVKH